MPMRTEIKFCGLTRREDVVLGRALGARYLGFVFAPSPRRLSLEGAQELLQFLSAAADDSHSLAANREPQRVGVFADVGLDEVARVANALALDVVQLHGADDHRLCRALRPLTSAQLWSVLRVGPQGVDAAMMEGAQDGDAIVLDARVEGALGGTGHRFDWERVGQQLEPLRDARPIILAGGLTPANVGRAISLLKPAAVDVSSGVEHAPGLKDHSRMRAFADAVFGAA